MQSITKCIISNSEKSVALTDTRNVSIKRYDWLLAAGTRKNLKEINKILGKSVK